MFLTKWWSKLRIRSKIFVMTLGMILTAGVIIFGGMYSYMPKLYSNYKSFELQATMDEFISDFESSDDYITTAFEFNYNRGIQVFVLSDNNTLLYPLTSITDKFSHNIHVIRRTFQSIEGAIYVEEDVYLESIGMPVTVIITSSYRPIDDATALIVLFIPFMSAIVVAMALILAFVNARYVARPFVNINAVAKKVAKLDFSSELAVVGDDEIAQLATSINEMSNSLEDTIKRLEQSNEKLKSDIEKERQIERERREFIATISHELKSPLTIISGQLEGMSLNIGKYKDHDKYLNESLLVANSMQKLVQEILSLNKLETQQLNVNAKPFDLAELIESLLKQQSYFIEERKIVVTKNLTSPIEVLGDYHLLERAMRNIIENACFYSDGFVSISWENNELIIENSYRDFPESEISQLFKPFYRVDKSRNRKTGGSGLGLYIVKMILEKHENITYRIQTTHESVQFSLTFKNDI